MAPIDRYHEQVRQRIKAGEKGLAQSAVGRVLVSYEVRRGITHGPRLDMPLRDILEEMIVDIAEDKGICGPRTWRKGRIVAMIEDRRLYPKHWDKLHKEADLLEAFYLEGKGQELLR